MESKFSFLATGRPNEELRERIDNRQNYLPETVEASLAELQSRGHEFSDEEVKVIREDIQAQRANAATITANTSLFNTDYKNALVEDPDAPLMYSRRVIYLFSFGFGAIFGSIMMAMNVSKTEKRNEAFWIVLFGVVITALQIWFAIITDADKGRFYGYLGGLIAAYCLDYFFWKRYIGYATFYKARSFWVPLIIALIILTPVLIVALLAIPQQA